MSHEDPPARAVLSADTSPEAERLQIELWRRMSPVKKKSPVNGLSRSALELSLAGIRLRHPGASEHECWLRLALLTLGRSVASRVYPDLSLLSGG
jgi:hypothetical protein